MRWLLDTNTVIFGIRNRPEAIRIRLRQVSPDDVVVSTITLGELWYGVAKSRQPHPQGAALERFLEPYQLLPFDRSAAERYGLLRHQLRHAPISDRDLLIAAIAVTNDLTVVTHNASEFGRVPGLRVEDWSVDTG